MSDFDTDSGFESEDGQIEELGEVEDSEISRLDINELGDHYITVRVDGEDVDVLLSEAVAGYSRQSDYTRKTQELATQKSELQWATAIKQALDNDPAGTLKLLSSHYGVSNKEAQQMVNDDDFFGDGFDEVDPMSKRLQEFEKRVSVFEQAQAQQELQVEISRLQTKYGEDFDAREVVAFAVANNNSDLEGVFKQLAFDRVSTRGKQNSAESKTVESKRAASVVSGASSAKGGKNEVGTIRTISDAWNSAKRTHGVS